MSLPAELISRLWLLVRCIWILKKRSIIREPKHHKELLPVLKPTIEKVADIIKRCVAGHDVEEIYLVGGTCCLTGVEDVVEKYVGIPTYPPKNPMFVTPLGIAKSCTKEIIM